MKRKSFISKNSTKNQKKLYIILIGLALLALIIGIVFLFMINNDSKLYIKDNLGNSITDSTSNISLFSL